MIASLLPGPVSGLPSSPSVPAPSAGVWSPSYASVVPSVSLSASICPLRSSESVVRSRTPSRAPPRASLRPDNASGEARAADRHGASPLVHPGSQPNDQPVFCRPAATPETVHRMRYVYPSLLPWLSSSLSTFLRSDLSASTWVRDSTSTYGERMRTARPST